MRKAAQQVQAETNYFEFTVISSIKKSNLDEILNMLNRYKSQGWIHFEEPQILSSIDDTDDDEKYFKILDKQDARDLRM